MYFYVLQAIFSPSNSQRKFAWMMITSEKPKQNVTENQMASFCKTHNKHRHILFQSKKRPWIASKTETWIYYCQSTFLFHFVHMRRYVTLQYMNADYRYEEKEKEETICNITEKIFEKQGKNCILFNVKCICVRRVGKKFSILSLCAGVTLLQTKKHLLQLFCTFRV